MFAPLKRTCHSNRRSNIHTDNSKQSCRESKPEIILLKFLMDVGVINLDYEFNAWKICIRNANNSYPFKNENNESSHHWLIHAVVHVLWVFFIFLIIISPAGPSSKDNNRSLKGNIFKLSIITRNI